MDSPVLDHSSFPLPHGFSTNGLLAHMPIVVDVLKDRRLDLLHWHDYVQLWYVLKGQLVQVIDGVAHVQEPGSIAVILPYVTHTIDSRASTDAPMILCLSFDDEFLTKENIPFFSYDHKFAYFEGRSIPTLYALSGARRVRADDLALEMLVEFRKRDRVSYHHLRALVYDFFGILCADAESLGRPESLSSIRDRGELITHATRYMTNHLLEKHSIDSMCSVAMMSRRMFTDNFRDVTGHTFANYYLAARLEHARYLLLFTDLTLAELAELTGFANKSHLARAFAKSFGVSPALYRKRMRAYSEESNAQYLEKWRWALPDSCEKP